MRSRIRPVGHVVTMYLLGAWRRARRARLGRRLDLGWHVNLINSMVLCNISTSRLDDRPACAHFYFIYHGLGLGTGCTGYMYMLLLLTAGHHRYRYQHRAVSVASNSPWTRGERPQQGARQNCVAAAVKTT